MNRMKRMLALVLAVMLLALTAQAEVEVEPIESAAVEELGEIELGDVAIAAPEPEVIEPAAEPEAPAEPEPMSAEPAPEPETVELEPPVEDPGEYAVAAPEPFQTSVTLGVKECTSLNGLVLSGGQPVSYVSSKPKVASVDENGLVLARKKGKAVVTVYLGEAALGACEVTVLKAPGKVKFPDKSIVLSKDQARCYPASLPKGTAGTISYASDNPGVLGVDAYGNLYGVSGGTATLTATAYNGKKVTCAVRVLGGPAPTWVALNQTSVMLPVKGTTQLAAFFDEGKDAILTYSTSNKKIATVNADGLVTAKKAGQATITVTTHNGLTATCAVQVYILPKKVTLNTKKLKMYPNEGFQLTATITKNSVSEIAWTSGNPGVATVDGNGLVAAVNPGTANITATTSNGKKATCKITVQDPSGSDVKLIFEENTDTLRVKIMKVDGMLLTYVWAANPARQLFKHYNNNTPEKIMSSAVKANGLADKLVVAFNSSPPVNQRWCPSWNKDSKYRYREPSPLMIANGQVLVNDPNKVNSGKYLYWIDGIGQLRSTPTTMEKYTADERTALYNQIIASGATNTMIWRPLLIDDYRPVALDAEFLRKTAGNKKKHALCQVDANNFIIVTTGDKNGSMDYPHFQQYLMRLGVRIAVEFDGGGSSTLLYKSRTWPTAKKAQGNARTLSMLMYFTE